MDDNDQTPPANPSRINPATTPAVATTVPIAPGAVQPPGTLAEMNAVLLKMREDFSAELKKAHDRAAAAESRAIALEAKHSLGDSKTIVMQHCNTCGYDCTDDPEKFCRHCGVSALINHLALDRDNNPFIARQTKGVRGLGPVALA